MRFVLLIFNIIILLEMFVHLLYIYENNTCVLNRNLQTANFCNKYFLFL